MSKYSLIQDLYTALSEIRYESETDYVDSTVDKAEMLLSELESYIETLEYKSKWLECLEAAGVDNWEGCEYASELMEDE